jgi:propanol-preferring alcohol dehydrogenase
VVRAWVVERPRPIASGPLRLVAREPEALDRNQVLVRVLACGVCRTDLHVAEGDLPPVRPAVVPGHEVIGRVETMGPGATRFAVGDLVGVAWLGSACGACSYCRTGRENLCRAARFTGYHLDGGYAELVVADERFAYALPAGIDPVARAPLMCAGIIGYRALKLAAVPPGGRLGMLGFGGSAHLAAQVAIRQGLEVHVVTRSEQARRLALELGAASACGPDDELPTGLDGCLLFAPSGDLVPVALEMLAPGGTLAIAGIHLSPVPPLDYRTHLFDERTVRSVTANTRADGEELLRLADRLDVRATVQRYDFEDAPRALSDLATGRVRGAAVLDLSAG